MGFLLPVWQRLQQLYPTVRIRYCLVVRHFCKWNATIRPIAKLMTTQHQRDPDKTYMQQLQEFSKTPVGAAGWSGSLPPVPNAYTNASYLQASQH